jgi:thiol-disulfide isomerase/thioredoxin
MLERLAIVIALGVLVALAVFAVRAWNAKRVNFLMQGAPVWDSLGETPDGRATLISFSSPSCAACHTAQAPALRKVEQHFGPAELRVINIDVARHPEAAAAFGVMTVPSTVVLAPAGQIVAVNQGFAPTRKLVEQLQSR